MENSHASAFPCDNNNFWNDLGLSKREYFIAMAMQGLLSNPSFPFGNNLTAQEQIAICSIGYADEILKQLNKTK